MVFTIHDPTNFSFVSRTEEKFHRKQCIYFPMKSVHKSVVHECYRETTLYVTLCPPKKSNIVPHQVLSGKLIPTCDIDKYISGNHNNKQFEFNGLFLYLFSSRHRIFGPWRNRRLYIETIAYCVVSCRGYNIWWIKE